VQRKRGQEEAKETKRKMRERVNLGKKGNFMYSQQRAKGREIDDLCKKVTKCCDISNKPTNYSRKRNEKESRNRVDNCDETY
jgi:hypothetical protein